jgi:hypothetical protein
MEDAGRYKPELIQAMFDQGVSRVSFAASSGVTFVCAVVDGYRNSYGLWRQRFQSLFIYIGD